MLYLVIFLVGYLVAGYGLAALFTIADGRVTPSDCVFYTLAWPLVFGIFILAIPVFAIVATCELIAKGLAELYSLPLRCQNVKSNDSR